LAGNAANITFIDPKTKTNVSGVTQSKSSNNPFIGIELSGAVVHTLFEGVFTVRDGKIQELKNA
jgi:dihydroorotase